MSDTEENVHSHPSVQAHITGIRQECYLGDGAEIFYKFLHCILILHNQVTQSGVGGFSGCGNCYMTYTQDVFTNSIGYICIAHASRVTYNLLGIHTTHKLTNAYVHTLHIHVYTYMYTKQTRYH